PAGEAALRQSAAVALFVQRAQALRPAFHPTPAEFHSVAEICLRLDGLPLAIELAAAQSVLFSPAALLARLGGALESRPLAFLRGGARDLPARQQTLTNAIDWSYVLLDQARSEIFRQLAIFVGSFTLA